jgi:SAM-dependent methyltransferase
MTNISLEDFLIKSEIKSQSDGIYRYIDSEYHSNFGYQWNQFSKTQLDSYNGSNESEGRLLEQSELEPEEFNGKFILEIGAGNGRFTEILLKYGAKVVAVDYSNAIDANNRNNSYKGDVLFLQADLFNLPLKPNSFDIVLCYGVIQHTGNNIKAIEELSKFPKKDGRLLIDIYSNGLRHLNPWVYLIRPFFSLIKSSDEKRLILVKRFVEMVFPIQLSILNFLFKKKGLYKFLRYVVNRSPNSVYGINLYLNGDINIDIAKEWCILDTYDGWAPKHDHPVSKKKWSKMIQRVSEKQNFEIQSIKQSGQGHTSVLKKII